MKPNGLRIGQTVIFDGQMAKIDSFSRDLFTGEPIVIVEVLGELKVVHPQALTRIVKGK